MRLTLTLIVGLFAAFAGGCQGSKGSSSTNHDADYTLVYLTSGPRSGIGDPQSRQTMFAGHMANINRLAEEGKLVVAGPFDKPGNPSWRGIFVLDVPSTAEALLLSASDPGVVAGEFAPEAHRMKSQAILRRTMEVETEARRLAPSDADGTRAPAIRGYVMVTAEDFALAEAAIEKSRWAGRTVWSGRLTGTRRGVFVLDETDPADVRLQLRGAGSFTSDSWWSTSSLVALKDLANGR